MATFHNHMGQTQEIDIHLDEVIRSCGGYPVHCTEFGFSEYLGNEFDAERLSDGRILVSSLCADEGELTGYIILSKEESAFVITEQEYYKQAKEVLQGKPENITPATQNNSEFLSIDSVILDGLLDALSRSEKLKLIDSYNDILRNLSGGISTFQGDSQQFLDELEKLIPYYQPLLRESLDEFSDETYITKQQFADIPGQRDPSEYEPRLLIEGEETEYAFLQVAAYMAGLPDDNLRLWYGVLHFILIDSLEETVH
ncbi:MAG: hypothetical protein ABII81_02585 [Pseudomonadota bacterium]